MTPLPGYSDTIGYDIELQTSEPVRPKFNPVPVNLTEYFDKEVGILLELKIIHLSAAGFTVLSTCGHG